LALLGLESLEARIVRSLSKPEARALAWVEALTSPSVRAILADEPLVGVDSRAAGLLLEALRARGRAGCAVVVTTASVRDASEFADDLLFLRAGNEVGRASSFESLANLPSENARLVLVAPDVEQARLLIAAVAGANDVARAELEGLTVTLRGGDPTTMARWAAQAAIRACVDIVELCVESAPGWAA
jgi:ABC-type multidrug transport system ATPase subunit